MALLFDEHIRSKVILQLIAIRVVGLANPVLLYIFSDELINQKDPKAQVVNKSYAGIYQQLRERD